MPQPWCVPQPNFAAKAAEPTEAPGPRRARTRPRTPTQEGQPNPTTNPTQQGLPNPARHPTDRTQDLAVIPISQGMASSSCSSRSPAHVRLVVAGQGWRSHRGATRRRSAFDALPPTVATLRGSGRAGRSSLNDAPTKPHRRRSACPARPLARLVALPRSFDCRNGRWWVVKGAARRSFVAMASGHP